MALKITDLPVDALSCILASVAKLPDGATDIAKSISVCKRFLEAGKSNIVYDVVCFQKVQVHSRHHLFQRTDGLLYSCAGAGNLYAQFLLAQVILKSSTQLERCGIKSARLSNLMCVLVEHNLHKHVGHVIVNDTSNANNVVKEEVRVKALLDFDRVSRVFPGFAVLKPKK